MYYQYIPNTFQWLANIKIGKIFYTHLIVRASSLVCIVLTISKLALGATPGARSHMGCSYPVRPHRLWDCLGGVLPHACWCGWNWSPCLPVHCHHALMLGIIFLFGLRATERGSTDRINPVPVDLVITCHLLSLWSSQSLLTVNSLIGQILLEHFWERSKS